MYQPDDQEAFDRVSQKIRDIKKYRLKAANSPVGSRKISQKRTSKYHLVVVVCFWIGLVA